MGRPKLQSVTNFAGALLAVLAVLAAGCLVWVASELSDGTRAVARNGASVSLTDDLQLALLSHSRAANLAFATGAPDQVRLRDALEVELEILFGRAGRLTGDDAEEERRLGAARTAARRYLTARDRFASESETLPELVAAVRPTLDQAVAAIDALRQHNEAEMARTEASAAELDRLANVLGGSIVAIVVLTLLGSLIAMRRYVVQPLRDIRAAVGRWQAGGPREEAPEQGLRETVDIARAFNDMSAELARQREAQLTFLAGVAHDLRNPLGAVAMAVESLHDDCAADGHGSAPTLALLERQVTRLGRMIGDLLDATRIEAGHLELEMERLDLREPIREVAALYGPTSPAHEVIVSVPPGPVWVRADALRVEQVLSNLVSNAIKYSPEGGRVRLSLAAHDDEACMAVSDEGRGIPSAEIDAIFEPFRRRRETKNVAPGVGLGLSVVRRIVRAHGGDVVVRSEPGRGSTFQVRLPLRMVAPEGRRSWPGRAELDPA